MAYPTDPIYKLIKDPIDGTTVAIRKSCGGGLILDIPFAEDNRHYQEYLAWVAEGNTAEEAD